jgi:hypothetical protein
MIVLKMGASGGYADQIGMTHPLARLVMIAIISAAAIGGFRWLKHELGDHTRHELTHLVSDLSSRGREGYRRGQGTYDRARNLNSRAPWNNKPLPDQSDTPDEPDHPLTGPPVNGRPPGGSPPSPGHPRGPMPEPPPTTPAPTSATATPSARAAGTVAADVPMTAAKTATVAVAPEAVAGAALASHLNKRIRRDRNPHGGDGPTMADPAIPSAGAAATPGVTPLAAGPVVGRAGSAHFSTTRRANAPPGGQREHPDSLPQPQQGDPPADHATPLTGR